ncbi:hypothetical protein MNB_SV-10-1291 [hydrothermal vent metagenome]|uniref:Uncharacterized protein n=1 Tax=hydrothermal vent metagenome TaxID=652676 RepID=A0A1W1CRJ3_9ZZZZ
MKKTSLIAAALVASFGIVGCGGGSSSDGAAVSTKDVAVSGKAIDPELISATVCLDLNRDGNCSANELSATTDGNGKYQLNVSSDQMNGNYSLVAVNGVDEESGEAFKGTLIADINGTSQNITPLTTLMHEQMQYGSDQMQKMEDSVGLSFDDMQKNIITLANDGNTTALKVALVLEKSAEAIDPKDTIKFFEDLAQKIDVSGKADNLVSLILEITPDSLKSQISSLIDTIMNAKASDAYDLAEKARSKAAELGIDQDEMSKKMPHDMPGTPDTNGTTKPGNPDMPKF